MALSRHGETSLTRCVGTRQELVQSKQLGFTELSSGQKNFSNNDLAWDLSMTRIFELFVAAAEAVDPSKINH